jgi:uncharacterized iron-regulated membrane protein
VPRDGGSQKNGTLKTLSRRLHALVGIVSSLNLLILIGSGLLLQHASLFRLDEKTVSRSVLPSSYRPQDGDSGVRADIFVTDLHSGRLLGTTGTVLLDVLTFGWLALLLTGVVMYIGKQRGKRQTVEPDSERDDAS